MALTDTAPFTRFTARFAGRFASRRADAREAARPAVTRQAVTRQAVVCLVLCGLVFAAATAGAQWHDHGYITSSGDEVFVFNRYGEYRFANVAPVHFDIFDIVMDADDQQALLVMRRQAKIVRFDPATMTVTGTLHAGAPFVRPDAVVVDQNGDYFVVDSGANAVFKIDRLGGNPINAIYSDPLLDRAEGGMRIDPATGDLLILNTGVNDRLLRVRRDGSFATVVGTGFRARFGFDIDIPTSDIVSSACCFPAHLRVLHVGQTVASTLFLRPPAPHGYYSLRADRASDASTRMVASPIGPDGGLWFIDLTTTAVTSLAVVGPPMFAIEHLQGRNVQPTRVGHGQWDIQLSFPDEGGLGYVTVLGVSGNRPSYQLRDGRRINLAIDPVTQFSLVSELPGVFWGNIGVLDQGGHGLTHLDVNPLGQSLWGVRFFVQTLTLDPTASLGIRTIADPVPLVIE